MLNPCNSAEVVNKMDAVTMSPLNPSPPMMERLADCAVSEDGAMSSTKTRIILILNIQQLRI
jgi:hypothetical protein